MEQKQTAFGTAGLVVGTVGLCLSIFPVINIVAAVLGLLGIVFGIVTFAKKGSKIKATLALIFGGVAIVVTVAVFLLIFLFNDIITSAQGGNTDELLATSVDVSYGGLELDDNWAELSVKITNKTDERKTISATVELVDKNGNRLGDSVDVYVHDLGPGQTQTEETSLLLSDAEVKKLRKKDSSVFFQVAKVRMY